MLLRAVCVLLAAWPVWAGDARVEVRFTPSSPSLSDTIRVEVNLAGADSADLALRPVDVSPDCVVVQAVQPQTVDGRVTRQILTLDPVKPGLCVMPPFRTRCVQGRTEACDVRSAETVIPIGTLVASGVELPDIRDSDEQPVELHDKLHNNSVRAGAGIPWVAGLALLVVAIACGASWVWRARRANAGRQAQQRLRRLAEKAASGSDTAEDFTQLTGIFRDYLDARLAMGARSCTSPEIIEALRRRSLCEGWVARELEDFLAASDRAKFSGTQADAAEFHDTAEKCLTLVQVLEFDIARRSRARV